MQISKQIDVSSFKRFMLNSRRRGRKILSYFGPQCAHSQVVHDVIGAVGEHGAVSAVAVARNGYDEPVVCRSRPAARQYLTVDGSDGLFCGCSRSGIVVAGRLRSDGGA